MKLFTWFLLMAFSSLSVAHEDGFLSSNAHAIYHLLMWGLALSIAIAGVLYLNYSRRSE
jgi:hypothetical protein